MAEYQQQDAPQNFLPSTEDLSCKASLGNAISQKLGSVVLAELVIKQISAHPNCGLACDCL